jgi:hypothetical protein
MPRGRLFWWREKDILISSSDGDLHILNLDSLEVDDANQVSLWRDKNSGLKERVLEELQGTGGNGLRWEWKFSPWVESAELPEVEGVNYWPVNASRRLAIMYPGHDSRLVFPFISVDTSDRFLMSKDGCKVLRGRGSQIDILYFKAGVSPHLKWEFAMPHTIRGCPEAARVEAALRQRRLCALIYGPMVNPLTGKVVGPDRTVVRGLVRVSYWIDRTATVYLISRYGEIRSGDVIADLSIGDDEPRELLHVGTFHRWWTMLPEALPGSDKIASIPAIEDRSSQRGNEWNFTPGIQGRDDQPSRAGELPRRKVPLDNF